jgi:hypothetical protein
MDGASTAAKTAFDPVLFVIVLPLVAMAVILAPGALVAS